jgi:hypothetical protein
MVKNHIFFISFFVFIFINLIENLLHYDIGRNTDKGIKLTWPTKKDWIRIIVVMIIFAILQGLLTYYFDKRLD